MNGISRDSPWRTLGDVTFEQWATAILSAGGPEELASEDCWEAARPHSALLLNKARAESTYGSNPGRNVPAVTKNPFSLRRYIPQGNRPGIPDSQNEDTPNGYLHFATWAEGVTAGRLRITDPDVFAAQTYNAVNPYPATVTLAELIAAFAPPQHNPTERIIRESVDALNSYEMAVTTPSTGEQEPVMPVVAATIDFSGLSFPVEVKYIPDRLTNQQPQIRMDPMGTTFHDTGNTDPNTDAEMHYRYLMNGAPDRHGRSQQLSYHLTVDDKKAIQCIQFNRVAWHGGDTSGPCNMRRIAIEMCIGSDSNVEKAYQNACELHGYLNAKLGLPWETELHQACSGKWCSAWVLNRGKQPEMKQRIAQHTNRFKGAPAPTLPKPIAAPSPLRDVSTADGAPLLVFNQKRQLHREVTTRMWAQKQGTIVAPGTLPKGREVHVSYLCEGDDGMVWVITQEGWRFHADALVA
jgi:hypothetical protein